ncbi:MAG: hypothetical protein PHO63_06740 [Bacilli bacterium]|nr:hypothetical protein [Bacilli bacterium]MDD4809493.1 hypothetical protein [Bacilli bacterium]
MARDYSSKKDRGITPKNDLKGNNIDTYRERGPVYIKEDKDVVYAQMIELFYEDEKNHYFFNCSKSNHVWLVFPIYEKTIMGEKIIDVDETIKVLVKDALAISLTTIDELEKIGLNFIKQPKQLDNKVLKKRN